MKPAKRVANRKRKGPSLKFYNSIISVNENATSQLFENRTNDSRSKYLGEFIKKAAINSRIVIPLHPYWDMIDSPEVNQYIEKGEAKFEEDCLISSNCWIIMTLGLLRLSADITQGKVFPDFEFRNPDDTTSYSFEFELFFDENNKERQRIRRLMPRGESKELYNKLKEYFLKYKNTTEGIYQLVNFPIFVKYNAVRYFYHANTVEKDLCIHPECQELHQSLYREGKNILYNDQVEEEEVMYCSNASTPNLYRIIQPGDPAKHYNKDYNGSMLDLLMSLISMRLEWNAFDTINSVTYNKLHRFTIKCRILKVKGFDIVSHDKFVGLGSTIHDFTINDTKLKDVPMFIPAVMPQHTSFNHKISSFLGLIPDRKAFYEIIEENIQEPDDVYKIKFEDFKGILEAVNSKRGNLQYALQAYLMLLDKLC